MKYIRKILLFVFIFSIFNINYVKADEVAVAESSIVIDGKYDDWEGMPSVIDKSGDASKGSQDLKEVRYMADDNFLYLYIERYAPGSTWDIWIPFPDVKGEGTVFYPWEHGNKDKVNDWEWKDTKKVALFKITCEFSKGKMGVHLDYGSQKIGSYWYNNSDGLRFEIALPLEKVGLNGIGKEIKFSVASDISQWSPTKVDWINDDGPIIVTDGPIFGSMTSLVVLSSFIGVGYIIKKREE